MYLGAVAALGLSLLIARMRKPGWWCAGLLIAAGVLNGAQVLLEQLSAHPSSAGLRIVLGAMFGVAVGLLLPRGFQRHRTLVAIPWAVLGLVAAASILQSGFLLNTSSSLAALTCVGGVALLLTTKQRSKKEVKFDER